MDMRRFVTNTTSGISSIGSFYSVRTASQVGDVILTYDGQNVLSSHQFTNTLELFRGDRARELRIERAQRVLSLNVPPGRLQGLELAERAPVINLFKRP